MDRYNLFNLLKAYQKNKALCDAFLSGKSIEGIDNGSKTVMGLTVGVFSIFLIVSLILFVVALVLLIKNWKVLPVWAQVVGVIGFFIPFGNIITIVVVLIAKGKK